MGKAKLPKEERRIFGEISWAIGDGKPHPLEDIKGVAVKKEDRKKYITIFVEKGLYRFDEENYIITKEGKDEFRKMMDSASRKQAAGRLVY